MEILTTKSPDWHADPHSMAMTMFDAYNEQGPNPWKTFDGRDVPRWNELNDQVRAKWVAAAEAAIRYLRA